MSPDDIKEFVGLCKMGKLFAAQEWIASGKPHNPTDLRWDLSPLGIALDKGFHSLLEVLLKAGVTPCQKEQALFRAVGARRLDLIEILVEHGADPKIICFDQMLDTGKPEIISWFVDRGTDLETGFPFARAFINRRRGALGLFMQIKEKVPSAIQQATMALRFHCKHGSMRWVSLLLWAGADPRFKVPDLDYLGDEVFNGTALEDAVKSSQTAIVRKIGLDPAKDDLTELLGRCGRCKDPEIVRMLLELGANPNGQSSWGVAIDELIRNFRDCFDKHCSSSPEAAVKCLELAGATGGRWRPSDKAELTYFRRAIVHATPYSAISYLKRIIDAGVIEQGVFRELMSSQRMRELLTSGVPRAALLREFAGQSKLFADARQRRMTVRKRNSSG